MTKRILLIYSFIIPLMMYGQGKVSRYHASSIINKSYPSNISKPNGFENNHGYVDLELSSGTLWAICNIGANLPTDYGDYFAWAEIKPKKSYTRDKCSTYEMYYADGIKENIKTDTVTASIRVIGHPKHDAALANWKGDWSLPSDADFAEFNKKCSWVYKVINGHKGYVITGPNSNNIFLPAGGYIEDTHKNQVGTAGFYWTGDYWDQYERSSSFNFSDSSHNGVIWSYRDKGKTIRPILKKIDQIIQ